MKQPLISIITVVLNGVSTIEETFASVFSQSFTDFEYIVIDGGSKDGTVEIIKENEFRLAYWVSEPDQGIYDAMNKAVCLAKGNWIYFLGADDVLYSVLADVADYLVNANTLYYGDVFRPLLGRSYDGRFSPYKLSRRNICHQSIFYPKYVWQKYLFNLKYQIFADYELNMRCFSDSAILMNYIPLTIAIFNDEGGMSPTQCDKMFEEDRLALIKSNFSYIVYVLACLHFGIIRFLTQLKLEKVVRTLYHCLLTFLTKRHK